MKKIRYWILWRLLTESEDELLWDAIDARLNQLRNRRVTERGADIEQLNQDIETLRQLRDGG